MKYAIVENGIVVNIAESNWALADNWVIIPIGSPVLICDTYDGRLFYAPDGSVRMTPEQEYAANRINTLEAQLASYEAAFAEGVSEGWA